MIRTLIYVLFLSIPFYLNSLKTVGNFSVMILSVYYVGFCLVQWFLLGKEFDYRFKVFIRFNSSIERVVYRIFLGMILCLIIFNIIYVLPLGLMKNFFWTFWILFGLFHSWPTRGKIIKESVTSHLYEYKFLDKFEKTVFIMIVIFFIFSIPTYSNFQNPFTLRLNYDPNELISPLYWNFLYVNYLPFNSHPELLGQLWNCHLYIINVGLYISVFYVLLRYMFSRRLSLLGLLIVISSWSFYKMIEFNLGILLFSGNFLYLFWLIILVFRSSTYRSGIFLGLYSMYLLLCNKNFITQIIFSNVYLLFILLHFKNNWYRKKILKYALTGFLLTLSVFIFEPSTIDIHSLEISTFFAGFFQMISTKAFYKLTFLGIIFVIIFLLNFKKVIEFLFLDRNIIYFFVLYLFFGILMDFFKLNTQVFPFSYTWIFPFLCLIPLEFLFNKVKEFRSNINLIYLFYILTILLDSHFEVRVKLFIKNFIL